LVSMVLFLSEFKGFGLPGRSEIARTTAIMVRCGQWQNAPAPHTPPKTAPIA